MYLNIFYSYHTLLYFSIFFFTDKKHAGQQGPGDSNPPIPSPTSKHGQQGPSNPPAEHSTTPEPAPVPAPSGGQSTPWWEDPKYIFPAPGGQQGPCPAPAPQKAMPGGQPPSWWPPTPPKANAGPEPGGQQGPCLNIPYIPPTPPKAMPQHSAAASGIFEPAGSKAPPSEPDDFESCVDHSEGGTGRSKAWNAWQDSSWDGGQSGQQWSHEVDWRLHRQHGYNSGGIQSRARRGLKRMMLQEMRKLRETLGVPQQDLTVSEEAGLFESPSDMAEMMQNLATYRVGLEQAVISAAGETIHMAGVEKSLPATTPPWKPHGPHSPPQISGQERPRVPTLVPQVFSGPPPKATTTGQQCPAPAPPPPPPPPPIPPHPPTPPPLHFAEPKGQQSPSGFGQWAQHQEWTSGHWGGPSSSSGHWGGPSSSSSSKGPMMKSPPPGSPPPKANPNLEEC